MPTPLPARPSLDWLRKRAKNALRTLSTNRPGARLADAQLVVAREHGFASWRALVAAVRERNAVVAPDGSKDDAPVEALFRSMVLGDVEGVRAALTLAPGLVHATGPHPFWGGRPQALHLAVERKRTDLVRLLLQRGADVQGRNDEYMGWSPLLLAITGKQARIRRLLLRHGARVGLVEALALGDDRMVRKRLSQGRRALAPPAPNSGAYLMFARTPFAVGRLLALGESPAMPDHWGRTPLMAFSRLGPAGKVLVQRLLDAGIAATGETWARLNDRARLRAMAKDDARVLRDPRVITAAVEARHRALVRWLLTVGADANSRGGGEAGETCLHSAAWNGDMAMVELLLESGADPMLRDRQYDSTPAGWAATSVEVTGNARCVEVAKRLGWTGRE